MLQHLRLLAPAITVLAFQPAGPAVADGFFLQSDIGSDTRGGVVALQRGPLTFGANSTDYEGGKELYASVTYALQLGNVGVLKFGPTMGKTWQDEGDDDVRTGGKVSIERYTPLEFGSVYGLVDLNSVNNSWFVLGQLNSNALNAGIDLSRGGSDNYTETTLAFRKGFRDSPFSLRAGYKFDSDEAFLGFSINTF
ncbi:hypothetical protein RGQ15_20915 [Paracoccus sp. MBLB3053]|uniref:Porin n=1 Tax=Paracoccus aurantius TaxID=3073814 RepID=A0ABU2HYA8_9RHOB|nr:hypothetical protein [Paracoccus sp. MBLB3053]MDS9470016.1 hypothetical protein [Paracoccus sp. MBLB3053]